MSPDIRVLLADDHPVFRKGLRLVLEDAPDIRVVADVDEGDQAMEWLSRGDIDVAILDLDMPGKDGLQVAVAVRDARLAVKVILLTAHKSDALVNKALDAGLSGYLLKDGAIAEILDSVRAVHAGQVYISPQLSAVLLNRRARAGALVARNPTLDDLTSTERRVLSLVAEGRTSKDIGELLFISRRTVEHHRLRIGEKLNLRGSHTLMKFALAHKSELS